MTQRDEVDELRDAIEELQTVTVPGLESERDFYKSEVERLEAVVAFYANKDIYKAQVKTARGYVFKRDPEIEQDAGKLAREALGVQS